MIIGDKERVPRRGPSRNPKSPSLDKIFRRNSALKFDEQMSFNGGPSSRSGRALVAWSFMSALVDALIVLSLSCVFFISASFLLHFHEVSPVLFVAVYLMLTWVYMITCRAFAGASLGEWAFDLRLGQPHERMQSLYVLRVIFRLMLILLTGLFPLPLLSLISAHDIAGALTGLKLYSLK
jgi:hypothetical protein